jgi:NADPH-dependent curcumin reductase
MLKWSSYSIVPATHVAKLDRKYPLESHLPVFPYIGLAAVAGLVGVGQMKAGDSVVVSAAAGATGSPAVQVALALGGKVTAIAGGASKCRMLKDELHAHHCIDYRSEDVESCLKRICPNGIDVFFDNVGGPMLDAVLANLAIGARLVIGGAISQYDLAAASHACGLVNTPLLTFRRARMEGFVVPQFQARLAEFTQLLMKLYDEGRIASRAHIVSGLEATARSLSMLFEGTNNGKLPIQVSSPG